ncbi:MAG: RHS repeat-associated core domain-containing protein, partial [Coriobacteriia bacterium]|nr:RHS repeat-associated core domain-containing protein [Coriobacteriia bacterium]
AGFVQASYRYDTFGDATVSGTTTNPYAFNGERVDRTTGLQYLRARYLDMGAGRFVTQDTYLGTLTEPLSQNRFTYTLNDPLNYVDPSGHAARCWNTNPAFYACRMPVRSMCSYHAWPGIPYKSTTTKAEVGRVGQPTNNGYVQFGSGSGSYGTGSGTSAAASRTWNAITWQRSQHCIYEMHHGKPKADGHVSQGFKTLALAMASLILTVASIGLIILTGPVGVMGGILITSAIVSGTFTIVQGYAGTQQVIKEMNHGSSPFRDLTYLGNEDMYRKAELGFNSIDIFLNVGTANPDNLDEVVFAVLQFLDYINNNLE